MSREIGFTRRRHSGEFDDGTICIQPIFDLFGKIRLALDRASSKPFWAAAMASDDWSISA